MIINKKHHMLSNTGHKVYGIITTYLQQLRTCSKFICHICVGVN